MFIFLTIFLLPVVVLAHGDKEHKLKVVEKSAVEKETSKESLKLVSRAYLNDIQAIFKQKCMDCHAKNTDLPWYSKLPFVSEMIEDDVTEAKKHMDMSYGFPFKGHGDTLRDLKAIRKAIAKETMPPGRYLIMNWNSSLNEDEKKSINSWIDKSVMLLENSSAKQEEREK